MDIEKEREAFSRWVLTHPNNLTIIAYEENIMFDAWQAAKAQAIPEGFVVVPVRPNEKTKQKMLKVFKESDGFINCENIYKAMIEAREQDYESK